MLGLIVLPIFNIALYFGIVDGQQGLLNIAIGIMWIYSILNFLAMFKSDESILKEKSTNGIYVLRWLLYILTAVSAVHSIYWGYFVAPIVLVISVLILYFRRYELRKKKRF